MQISAPYKVTSPLAFTVMSNPFGNPLFQESQPLQPLHERGFPKYIYSVSIFNILSMYCNIVSSFFNISSSFIYIFLS